MDVLPTNDELLDLAARGGLAGRLQDGFGGGGTLDPDFRERAAELHNTGRLDILALVEDGSLLALPDPAFFLAQQALCGLIPLLHADAPRMMRCVEALIRRGGEDLAALEPNRAFRDWCAADPSRARTVVEAAEAGDEFATRALTFGLEALGAVGDARRLALQFSDGRQLSAITALGRIDDADPASILITLDTFSNILTETADDGVRAAVLHAAAAVGARFGGSPAADAVVREALATPGPLVLNQAALVLGTYQSDLSAMLVDDILRSLLRLDPANTATIRHLDRALYLMMQNVNDDRAAGFLGELLTRSENDIELSAFDSFTHALTDGPLARLSRVAARWLVRGGERLCGGFGQALPAGEDAVPFELQPGDLALSDQDLVLLCRHTVGYLFIHEKQAAAVLVSVLRVCSDSLAPTIQSLLLRPMLLNYGGLRSYLEALKDDDPARARVQEVLEANEGYLAALNAIPEITEFRPSDVHRRIEHLKRSDQMKAAQKAARRASVLFNLVSRSTVLHGNRTVTFVEGPDGPRALEIEMKSFGVSFEMPRMEVVDPVGLEFELLMHRMAARTE